MTPDSKYISVEQLLLGDASTAVNREIDAINFEYRGVSFSVYGVLHGLTGGLNKAYVGKVNEAISQSQGLRFFERNFDSVYQGLDVDTNDWAAIPWGNAFQLVAAAHLTPLRILRLFSVRSLEKSAVDDNFISSGFPRLQNIGGSMAFHALDPMIRRALAGFPDPYKYLLENLRRRAGSSAIAPPVFPDVRWDWMAHSEPYANIPLRSIHMLEFSAEYSRLAGNEAASIFVGEIHNSDMAWYASEFKSSLFDDVQLKVIDETARRAREMARTSFSGKKINGFSSFLLAATAGALMPFTFYFASLAGVARILRLI